MRKPSIRVQPGSPWSLIGAGTYRENYLDQVGRHLIVTIGQDHRVLKRVPCAANDEELLAAGVYREQYLDGGGFHQLLAVGEDGRILERVRIFDVAEDTSAEEARYANYLRHKYSLHDPRRIGRRCRYCRAWFVSARANRVRCRRCIDARKRKDGAA